MMTEAQPTFEESMKGKGNVLWSPGGGGGAERGGGGGHTHGGGVKLHV